jgi:hypothetical protein
MSDRSIFVNPSGQRDNLGDSVLRRAYLERLRTYGRLHVLVGVDRGYESGLGIEAEDKVYVSKRSWLLALLAARPGSIFALNAGEIVLGRRFLLSILWQLPAMLRVRLGKGVVVAAGIAVRDTTSALVPALRCLLFPVSTVIWRDPASARAVGTGSCSPDWAFALDASGLTVVKRDKVVIVLRGDRPGPTFQQSVALAGEIRSAGYEPVVAVQVRRDEALARTLASSMQCEVVSWPRSHSHDQQEGVIRDLYSSAAFVVSDRIHALIIGLTEGAAPIGTGGGSLEKVRRTLAAVADRDPLLTTPFDALEVRRRLSRTNEEIEYWRGKTNAAREALNSEELLDRHPRTPKGGRP